MMFSKNGPTFFELMHQALSSTPRGYDLLAPKFDATPFRTPDDVLEPSIKVLGEVEAALDVCCGTGAAMQFLRPYCRKRLVGIDFSPGMLQQAKQKLAQHEGTAWVEFVEADVLEMTFQEEFDAITCFGALGHILPQDQRTFARLIHRALKPGGRFVFVTAPHPHPLSLSSLILRSFNGIMKVRNALLKPPFIMYYLTFLLPEVAALLEQEGFQVEIEAGLLPDPYRKYCVVIATKIQPGGYQPC
jgi:ubiquinone/menaquinone biosynthesis C-methylase UbiE